VGAVILNEAGRVLALERRDITGAWQLPQGGLRIGEAPLAAVKREIKEETGVDGDLHLLFAIDRLLAYELPRSHRSKKTGRGQVQYWFIFRYRGAEERITLGDNKEFRRWKWTTMQDLSSNVVAFKKPVYQELGGFLARELGRGTGLRRARGRSCRRASPASSPAGDARQGWRGYLPLSRRSS
jgi:putative (di)nucleoside polyphosphate hydrolase